MKRQPNYLMRHSPNENADRKLRLVRSGATRASNKFGIGSKPKAQGIAPKPVTLPTLKFMQKDDGE